MKTAYGYIRLSSARQIKGTGEQRQSKLDEICKSHGWIASGQTFKDLGVSAWKGKNRLQGNLSIFIQLLKDNKLAAQPLLAVEAFDRISREDIDESEPAILNVLKLGCDIHVAFNNKTFTKESTKSLVDRIEILVSLKAAFDYSNNLSTRILAQQKIKKGRMANGEILKHHHAPRYYSFNKDTKSYEQNSLTPIIERIVKEYLAGKTAYQITNGLNADKVRALRYFNKQASWTRVGVKSILESKCLYGEFQGIAGYFAEPVIDKNKWDEIQMMIARNSKNTGHFSSEFVNIFKGLTECYHCHKAMSLGVQKKDYQSGKERTIPYRYLRCSTVGNCLPCKNRHNMNLAEIERSFFIDYLSQNPVDLINGDDKKEVKSIDAEIIDKQKQLNKLSDKVAALGKLAGVIEDNSLLKQGQELKEQQDLLRGEIDNLNRHRTSIVAAPISKELFNDLLCSVTEFDGDGKGKDKTTNHRATYSKSLIESNLQDNNIRLQLRNHLPNLISKIVFNNNEKSFRVFNHAGKEVFYSVKQSEDAISGKVLKFISSKLERAKTLKMSGQALQTYLESIKAKFERQAAK